MGDINSEIMVLIEKIKFEKKLVIVEGKKDASALKTLGIQNVIQLNMRPLYKIVEDVADYCKDCVILTDLDKEGKKLYTKISTGLLQRGVRVDNKFRDFLFKKTKLRQIEGICSYLAKDL